MGCRAGGPHLGTSTSGVADGNDPDRAVLSLDQERPDAGRMRRLSAPAALVLSVPSEDLKRRAASSRYAATSKDKLAVSTPAPSPARPRFPRHAPKPHRESPPNTWSPGRNWVTFRPAASTRPATSLPMILKFGLRSRAGRRNGSGVPRSKCQSPAFVDAAWPLTNTSPSPTFGSGTSSTCSTSGGP